MVLLERRSGGDDAIRLETDKEGRFRFGSFLDPQRGEQMLAVRAKRFAAAVRTIIPSGVIPPQVIRLAAPRPLRGRVVDSKGRAVAGAVVSSTREALEMGDGDRRRRPVRVGGCSRVRHDLPGRLQGPLRACPRPGGRTWDHECHTYAPPPAPPARDSLRCSNWSSNRPAPPHSRVGSHAPSSNVRSGSAAPERPHTRRRSL